jgi:hypothetical protein
MNLYRILPLLFAIFAGTLGVRADWPEFRGPRGDGHVPGSGLPLHWSETNNVKWKTEIPHQGISTPVVMDGQVWLTTATAEGHDFFAICVDAETGKIRFNEKIFHSSNPESLGHGNGRSRSAISCRAGQKQRQDGLENEPFRRMERRAHSGANGQRRRLAEGAQHAADCQCC